MDPICQDCDGYGQRLISQLTSQREHEPCPTCGGKGRIVSSVPPMVITTDSQKTDDDPKTDEVP